MTKKMLYLALAAMMSCNNNNKQTSTIDPPVKEAAKIIEEKTTPFCFTYVNRRDTITLHLNTKANIVTGELVYNLFEKDKNTGSIKGEMKGDTLFADYSFMSEGMNSAREVVFLKKGNSMVEGFGEVEEKNGKMVFKNTKALSFVNKIVLTSVECTK